ncbi:MAG: hypothetical protein IMY74_05955, partial [Bacteroidetes bacterium]|nr:hypothetical protein [Bacteroidota bacterium]
MKTLRHFSILILMVFIIPSISIAQQEKDPQPEQANWRVDNNGYWKMMAEKGLTTLNPMVVVPKAKYTGSGIEARSSATLDSPDVPVTTENSSQSENSIFVNPADYQNLLNSNNSCA